MSYILDALRKSEKERRRGNTPDLLTVQEPVAGRPSRQLDMSYLLLAFLVIGSGIILWWLTPWKAKKPEPAPQVTREYQQAPSETSATPLTEAVRSGEQQSNVRKPAEGDGIAGRGLPAAKKETAKSPSVAKPLPAIRKDNETTATTDLPLARAPQPSASVAKAADKRVYNLKELPESVRQALPEISMSVLYYDTDPAQRMVSINNRTVREGQEFAPGISLDEIIPDSAILKFQGYRFRIGLPH